MRTFLTVDQARALILKELTTLSTEVSHIDQALGRTLAVDVCAPSDAPGAHESSRDGYAVRWEDVQHASADTPVTLRVVEHVPAGHVPTSTVHAMHTARTMTGAYVAEGADTIVMREDCDELDADTVRVRCAPSTKGQWVRTKGSFVAKGEAVLRAGQRLGGGDIGTLAAFGSEHPRLVRRPRVAILSTGDELRELGAELVPGTIYNSNAWMLRALTLAHGGQPWVLPLVPDTHDALRAAYMEAIAGADLVISSGGASVGDHDHVAGVLEELCEGVEFWSIQMRPGKPLVFGHAGVPILGLPGNPASSFVCFHQFVRPALEALLGQRPQELLQVDAILTAEIHSTPKRRHYVSGRLHHDARGALFSPVKKQDSGNLRLITDVNALAIVEVGCAHVACGERVRVELL